MGKKWLLTVIVLLTVVNLSALGTFTYKLWCNRKPRGGDAHFRYLKKRVRLTDEQVSKMKDFREKIRPKIESLSREIEEKRTELLKELMAESPDTARIEGMLNEMNLSQSAIEREVVNSILSQKGMLSPQQRKKLFLLYQNKRRPNHK